MLPDHIMIMPGTKVGTALTISVPLQTNAIFAAAGTETPVWPETFTVIAEAVLLKIK
jgi:hypothetical protein